MIQLVFVNVVEIVEEEVVRLVVVADLEEC